ncbi:YciI family protein [Ulvibacter antarcticus]|uniref:Uncharacterized protein YciI n=1 Tax=Ulvibacter antarcticus TaxID=442714 RepID=A0A3L9Z764_9FLAO|nr:uncharacterized protein YciI [Ulvibacter antarcticus]
MEKIKIKKYITLVVLLCLIFVGCNTKMHEEHSHTAEPCPEKEVKSASEIKKELTEKGFQIFDYVDDKTGDTIIMQQYFMAYLKRGPNRSQSKEVADSLQTLHLAHLGRMYEEGFADISGPFGDDQDVRGITIYNVPTMKMADSLANLDPMVKSGRLMIEIRPWWAGKGFPLR